MMSIIFHLYEISNTLIKTTRLNLIAVEETPNLATTEATLINHVCIVCLLNLMLKILSRRILKEDTRGHDLRLLKEVTRGHYLKLKGWEQATLLRRNASHISHNTPLHIHIHTPSMASTPDFPTHSRRFPSHLRNLRAPTLGLQIILDASHSHVRKPTVSTLGHLDYVG